MKCKVSQKKEYIKGRFKNFSLKIRNFHIPYSILNAVSETFPMETIFEKAFLLKDLWKEYIKCSFRTLIFP